MNIPFFDYPAVFSKYKDSFLEIFDNVSSKGSFIMQDELLNFEKKIAAYSKCNFAVGVGNATDALEMLVNVNSDSKSYSLPVQNQYNRLDNFQIPPVIFGGIFYLMPKLLSEVRKDSKKHSKSLTEKLKSLNIKLNTDTLPKSLPKNIDSYPLILLM